MKQDGLNEAKELTLDERLVMVEIALETQGSINQRLIDLIKDLHTRIEFLEGNGHKPSALILPPGLNS